MPSINRLIADGLPVPSLLASVLSNNEVTIRAYFKCIRSMAIKKLKIEGRCFKINK